MARAARRMKQYLPIVLAIACAALVVSMIVIKRGDNAQHETDAGAIDDFSNQLDSAQTEVAFCKGTMLTLSNSLDPSQSAALTFSNQLTDAESNLALTTGQITNLTQQLAAVESENQTIGQRIMDLTNQMAGLMPQIGLQRQSGAGQQELCAPGKSSAPGRGRADGGGTKIQQSFGAAGSTPVFKAASRRGDFRRWHPRRIGRGGEVERVPCHCPELIRDPVSVTKFKATPEGCAALPTTIQMLLSAFHLCPSVAWELPSARWRR